MGYLKKRHGMTLFGKMPDGACTECAVKHSPEQPHNRDSKEMHEGRRCRWR